MALPVDQPIQAGSAQLLFTDAPVLATAGTITTVNNAGTAYSALAQDIVVADAAAIAPDVFDEAGTGSIGDPPWVNVICFNATKEIGWVTKINSGSQTIHVVRGAGKHWRKYSVSNTQYSSADSVANGAEIELLGKFKFPKIEDTLVITNGDVVYTITQGMFRTRDNLKGNQDAYTSEPANGELTCTLPHNTLPQSYSILGLQAITDGNTPAKYYAEPMRQGAGSLLSSKMCVIIPNSILDSLPTVTIGANNHLDISKCVVFFNAQVDNAKTYTYGEGSQRELNLTIALSFSDVCQKPIQEGAVDAMCEITEVVS